jgi:integrase
MEKQEKQQRIFTDNYIRNLKPKAAPYKLAEKAPKGEGRMIVRVLPNGTKESFYRYRAKGEDKTIALGRYDHAGRNGDTLAVLRDRALEKRSLQRSTGDVKAHLEAEERKKEAEERQQEIERRKGTFHQLLDVYVQSLRDAKKISADEAEGVFQRHVIKAFREIVAKRANEVEPTDIQVILAKMVKAGTTRQVNVCRAYLRAAFARGTKADNDPRTLAKDGVLFGLKYNPVASVPKIAEFERTHERTLTEDEIRAYWHALDKLPVIQRAFLRFNLASGQQRPKQLLRTDCPDFDFEENTMLLRDPKGRGGSRDHLVPLTSFALEQLKPLRELNDKRELQLTANDDGDSAPKCNTLFTVDGKKRMVPTTLSHAIAEVCATLKKEKKIVPFDQGDLRRTVETMLQKLRVDKEVRAHLLSHGVKKGIQAQAYERYDFLPEKRQALRKWTVHLERVIDEKRAPKVVPIRASA